MEQQRPTYKKIVRQSSVIYGMGLIGALMYFIQHSVGFWMGCMGVLKAIVWPVFIVYKLLEFLKL
jgi:hypothetical protein